MATTITFIADGITDPMEVLAMNFSFNSDVDVSNATKIIKFSTLTMSEIGFAIKDPTKETISKLVGWVTQHETKGSAEFNLRKAGEDVNPRVIKLQEVCLTLYSEDTAGGEDDTVIQLALRVKLL